MDYKYLYITWVTYTSIIWLILFVSRKDLRKSITFMSIVFGFLGSIFEYIHLNDWWHPQTITGTKLGIEDFMGSFFIAGTASSIYEFITNKSHKDKATTKNRILVNALFTSTTLILFFGIYYILKLHSFYSVFITQLYGIAFIFVLRKDLIKNAIESGILMLIIGSISYPILFYIFPDFIHKFWHLNNEWFQILIFGVPVEEPIWWFLTGTFIGPLYKFLYCKDNS